MKREQGREVCYSSKMVSDRGDRYLFPFFMLMSYFLQSISVSCLSSSVISAIGMKIGEAPLIFRSQHPLSLLFLTILLYAGVGGRAAIPGHGSHHHQPEQAGRRHPRHGQSLAVFSRQAF